MESLKAQPKKRTKAAADQRSAQKKPHTGLLCKRIVRLRFQLQAFAIDSSTSSRQGYQIAAVQRWTVVYVKELPKLSCLILQVNKKKWVYSAVLILACKGFEIAN
jgi:hypothetical protein